VSQSSEFCRHNPLCCFSTSNTKGKHVFRYRLSPETFGYTLVLGEWKYSFTHCLTSAVDGVEWSASSPGRFTIQGKNPPVQAH